jgi:hypothetical protein
MAQSCTSGTRQCQKTVLIPIIGCGSPTCLAVVNDDSALIPIETQWTLLGCGQLPGYECFQGFQLVRTGMCIAQNGGTTCQP